jgi:hypothetical protein
MFAAVPGLPDKEAIAAGPRWPEWEVRLPQLGFASKIRPFAVSRRHCQEAITLAGRHGWGTEPIVGQPAARMPRPALSEAMIVPPMVTARNDRAKLVWKNLCRSQARVSSSVATTAIAAMTAAP